MERHGLDSAIFGFYREFPLLAWVATQTACGPGTNGTIVKWNGFFIGAAIGNDGVA